MTERIQLVKNKSFVYNLLAERREADLGNTEAGDSKWYSDDRTAEDYASNHRTEPEPDTGEYYPNHIEQESAGSGVLARHDVLSEREEREHRYPERRHAVGYPYDCAAEHKPRDDPRKAHLQPEKQEPKYIADQ